MRSLLQNFSNFCHFYGPGAFEKPMDDILLSFGSNESNMGRFRGSWTIRVGLVVHLVPFESNSSKSFWHRFYCVLGKNLNFGHFYCPQGAQIGFSKFCIVPFTSLSPLKSSPDHQKSPRSQNCLPGAVHCTHLNNIMHFLLYYVCLCIHLIRLYLIFSSPLPSNASFCCCC